MREDYIPPQLTIHLPLTDVTGTTSDQSSDSDRNAKANFAPVAGQELLARLATVPISTWNYISDPPSLRHIGPMAPDFRDAFQVGQDGETIHNVDAHGVALAAIQGLYQLLREKDAQLAAQHSRIATLEARLAALEGKRRN
jgi:hypothetical protein